MQWLEPWEAITDLDWPSGEKLEFCLAWEKQLSREVGPRHVLFQQPAALIARNSGTDDALFQLADGRIAEVHLAWRKGVEPDPHWPFTAIFASFDDWSRESLQQWHREWQESNVDGSQ